MITLLYIDDGKNLLEIGKIFLEEFGDFSVTTLGSAQEGLEALITGAFDAIISHYQMPEMGNGQKKKVRGDFYPIRDAEGTVTHVILLHQDCTLSERTPTTKSRIKEVG